MSESEMDKNPFNQFEIWFEEYLKLNPIEPNAVVLATSNKDAKTSARVVLFRDFGERGIVFYTNYKSRKGDDLNSNPSASLLFYWAELERQIRINGTVEKISRKESEEYFHSRPRESQIGAWVSKQSTIIPDREFLEKKFKKYEKKFSGEEIPLPDYWGGYRVVPNYFEFWQGRENRLHDRIAYKKENQTWKIFRLSP